MDIPFDNERTIYGIAAGGFVHGQGSLIGRDRLFEQWTEDGETGLIKVKRTIPAWEEETEE